MPSPRTPSPELARVRGIRPIYSFPEVEEFVRRHKTGTKNEFAADEKLVNDLNKKNHSFEAWVLTLVRHTSKRSEYLFVVKEDPEVRLPTTGEICKVRIALDDGSNSRFWDARRVENPVEVLSIKNSSGGKLAAFVATVPKAETFEGLAPLPSSVSQTEIDVELSGANSITINFMLIPSEATKDSELGSLDLLYGRHANCSVRQEKAFEYFVTLRNPEFFVDLYELLPHIKPTVSDPLFPQSKLGKMFSSLNHQQREAFMNGFASIPCGICVLPGGPGAGKTHFNLFTIAMAQLQPLPQQKHSRPQDSNKSAKVLFIVDMNSPVDDVANRMLRLYEDLGMSKKVIRMKGWGAEVKLSSKLNEAEDAHGDTIHVDFTNSFIRLIKTISLGLGPAHTHTCRAPTLDEAAWEMFEDFKSTKYEELAEFLQAELWESEEVIPLRFRRLVYHLYRDTLAAADFVATTPVAAHNHFKGMFRPDLVYFDEAPHARELCNLIAIANFDPMAWIFCGDYRQTVPYVGSGGPDSVNEFADQMRVSMMERAAKADVIQHELLINHRSFGGLHQLASDLWYRGTMTSGTDTNTIPLVRMRRYLSNVAGGIPCKIPRILVKLKGCPRPRMDGTSCWSPEHTNWVMNRVRELLSDPKFIHPRRQELGTILIISPYKCAYEHYRNEIKKLPAWARKRVEARTVDVVQGHEADFVFLDLVKEKSTAFLDNANRLCVAVTRARLGESILMHPEMSESYTFMFKSIHLIRMHIEYSKHATPPSDSGSPLKVMGTLSGYAERRIS
ncbi:P-loop containing nucleoside triphosphate hydrolase protein [Cladorrhinum sp. PSN259]|nr:P-loop containing nucleoside triphosphate hydrolase protein [Cladorrhinum sp. PSN259]